MNTESVGNQILQMYLAKTMQQNFQPGLFFNILKKNCLKPLF